MLKFHRMTLLLFQYNVITRKLIYTFDEKKEKKIASNAISIKQFLQYYTIKKHLLPLHVILKPYASI